MKLNPEKSKVMVFQKDRESNRDRKWKWGDEKIEKVRRIRYLGYIMQKNGGSEKHIIKRLRRAKIAMKNTWSIEEKIFKDNYERRLKMFDALIGSVALYGAEIWG